MATKNYELRRPIQKIVRFSPEENEGLKQRLAQSPINNFQNYARILLLAGQIRVTDYSDLQSLISEVHRIGNNINQMAKLAHIYTEISSDEIQELIDVMVGLRQLVEERLTREIKSQHEVALADTRDVIQKIVTQIKAGD